MSLNQWNNVNTETFQNPIVEQRADPWVYKHLDGMYYFTATVPEYDRIELRRASRIQDLGRAESVTVWKKHESGPLSSHIWAPEIHYIEGKWYIYFAAAKSGDTVEGMFDHRMFVLENASVDPAAGTWTEKGQIVTDWESFSLDATTFEHRGMRYLVWAQHDPATGGNSNLYIAPMKNPWTIQGPQVLLSKPEYDWETIGFRVNEGPAVLKKHGKIFISYSASATDHHYCVGLLCASEDAPLLNPASWNKAKGPVFSSSEKNGQFGPGHNCFTVTADGSEDVIVYHARNYKEVAGDPLYDPNRHTRAQKLHWRPDGTPDFGAPAADDEAVSGGK